MPRSSALLAGEPVRCTDLPLCDGRFPDVETGDRDLHPRAMGSLVLKKVRLIPWLVLLLFWAGTLCAAPLTGEVQWVYDGDTVKVAGVGKVRLIGIDAPEREASKRDRYYQQQHQIPPRQLRETSRKALDFMIRHVKGRQVTLTFDRERHDRYGRTLAYLFLADGTLLNQQLLERGLASVYRRFDFRLKPQFLQAEARAQKQRRGMWARPQQ